MTHWNDGYVSDISYVGGVYREQTPAHLDAACLANGFEPAVEPDAPYTYCELGCGLGDTAMVIAASSRRARVWGFDFNPGHIARARMTAARAGLDNVEFEERSFEELAGAASHDLPMFDYITLHGVWSWVSPAAQGHIVAFLGRFLRPGGVVCISYNVMPGWAGVIGLQRLLLETARGIEGSRERRLREATALVRRVAELGARIDMIALQRLEMCIEKNQIAYAIHEYFNEHWRPVFFTEVAAALAPAKLEFVCSANLMENYPYLCMKPEQRALFESLPPGQRQTVQDFYSPAIFRRDVFVRGPQPLPARALSDRLRAQRLTLTLPGRLASCKFEIPQGEATLNEAFYRPALATLAEGSAAIGELIAAATPGTAPVPEEILGLLVGGRQVRVVSDIADREAVTRVRRYNRTRLTIANQEAQYDVWIACAAIGSVVSVGLVEILVYEVVAAGDETGKVMEVEEVVSEVRALLAARDMKLSADVPDVEQELFRDVRTIVEERVPIWRRLGAL